MVGVLTCKQSNNVDVEFRKNADDTAANNTVINVKSEYNK